MRDLYKLIDEMIQCIPECRSQFIHELKEVKNKIPYTAPEILVHRFHEVNRIVNNEIQSLDHDWKNHVVFIWTAGTQGYPNMMKDKTDILNFLKETTEKIHMKYVRVYHSRLVGSYKIKFWNCVFENDPDSNVTFQNKVQPLIKIANQIDCLKHKVDEDKDKGINSVVFYFKK